MLDVINPVMNQRIDWPWFVISQIAFGIVAGIVVSRQERISTWQPLPLAVREGVEVARSGRRERRRGLAVRNTRATLVAVAVLPVLMGVACSNSRGRPGPNSEVLPPREITDFHFLYAKNCAACHGPEGKDGAAVSLGDPLFLAIADDAVIRRIATTGVPGTPMPAFATSAGGMLTDKQIDSIVTGIRSWAKPGHVSDASLPPYAAEAPGDPTRGAEVYATYCSSCHGPDGRGGKKASSIVDGSYLSLVSDQQLRTIVIVGRPEPWSARLAQQRAWPSHVGAGNL